jgi:hypothetical protein
MTIIEITPHRNGWKVFEAPGVEPVFPEKRQAINYARNHASFGEIRAFWVPPVISNAPLRSAKVKRDGERVRSTFACVVILCVCAKSVGRLQPGHLTLFPQGNRERQGSLAQLEVL